MSNKKSLGHLTNSREVLNLGAGTGAASQNLASITASPVISGLMHRFPFYVPCVNRVKD